MQTGVCALSYIVGFLLNTRLKQKRRESPAKLPPPLGLQSLAGSAPATAAPYSTVDLPAQALPTPKAEAAGHLPRGPTPPLPTASSKQSSPLRLAAVRGPLYHPAARLVVRLRTEGLLAQP